MYQTPPNLFGAIEETDAHKQLRNLTPRELQVITEICSGKGLRDVAASLGLAHSTIDNHKSRAYRKLHVHNRLQLMLWALEVGIIESQSVKNAKELMAAHSLALRVIRT